MPSEVMDKRDTSSLFGVSSFFSDDTPCPTERQVGFWKSDSMPNHGFHSMGSKADAMSLLDKLRQSGTPSVECLDPSQPYIVKERKEKRNVNKKFVGAERSSSLSMTSWKVADPSLRSQSFVQAASLFGEGNKAEMNGPQYENSLFSSSLSDIFKKNLRLSMDVPLSQSVGTVTSPLEEEEPFESLKEIEAQTIGNLLPDDDDLLSGVVDDIECIGQPDTGDDLEDFDLFSSGGGMELEADDGLSFYCGNKNADLIGAIPSGQQGASNSSFAGEHPFGEHPSRTLFVRNINSNVEDSELRALFEQYGDIRTLYTACKHRGFVMISYYDIRAARNAMRALQNKPLRRWKLDIHFSIPKDNPSEKDINQGTLVIFNLDSSVLNDDLRQIFGVYGEIKEIRETPHKRHHKFIEFYDVRAAEAALLALNRSDIAGKRIKLEPSRPGGVRRCLMQQFSPELDQDETSGLRQQGSPPDSFSSGFFGTVPPGPSTSSGLENGAIQGLHSATRAPISPFIDPAFHGIPSSLPQGVSSPARAASFGNHSNQMGLSEPSHSLGNMKFGYQSMPTLHPHSLPEYHNEAVSNAVAFNSRGSSSAMAVSMNSRPADGVDNRHMPRVGSAALVAHFYELNDGVFGAPGNGSCPLHGQQYVWTNTKSYNPHHPSSMVWPNSPSFVNSVPAHPPHQLHGLRRAPSHMLNAVLPLHHHVGSAPAVNPSVWDRRHAYAGHSNDAHPFHPGSLGSKGYAGSPTLHPLEMGSHNVFGHIGANCFDPSMSSPKFGMPSPQQRSHMIPGRHSMIPLDAPNERMRGRRNEANSSQADNKEYELDLERIMRGEDTRTTLMIKNIPNKYTSKMLLAAIDEYHRGTYDFIYLPIDFKNKCNVGYAFINMIDPSKIGPFFEAFNGKKWEKFNSEKVASLAYARIQGKAALIAHFQNSSLMNEEKRCRPILFHSDGPNAGDQEPFPMGVNIWSRPGKMRTGGNEDNHQGSPSNSACGEDGTESSSGSTKDAE